MLLQLEISLYFKVDLEMDEICLFCYRNNNILFSELLRIVIL